MKAPRINYWIHVFKDGRTVFGEETTAVIDRVFEKLNMIAPCGDDGRRDIWLKADRGAIEDFDDFEYLRDEGIVSTYENFVEMWQSEYPDQTCWFHLTSIDREGFRALFIGRNLIYQSDIIGGSGFPCEWERKDLFVWMESAIEKCVEDIKNGVYNADLKENLPPRNRTGVISRKDYWDAFPDNRDNMPDDEKQVFLDYIKDQTGKEPIGEYIPKMTANMFYEFCSIGYKANNYNGLEGRSPKEQYYRHADGRDEGLSEIDPESEKEFEKWFFDREQFGGHPWEVCRGGNSTHIDLYVENGGDGFYLVLRGRSWSRYIETIRFYNALRKAGVAVWLSDAKGIKNRLLGEDMIGVVPDEVIPIYCEGLFPDMEIMDFMNLPWNEKDCRKMIGKVVWFEEDERKLVEKY